MSRSVLVVDDDAEFRALASRILTGWGHRVVGEAGTVAQALRTAIDTQPDLAVVDVGLPDGDGLSLARQLRSLPRPPRVVLISSDADPQTVARARRVGARDFFLKEHLSGAAFQRCVDGRTPA